MINWYLQSGKEADVVVSTRIRLARNFNDIPFEEKSTIEDKEVVLKRIEKIIPQIGFNLKLLRLSSMDDITKLSLIEKHIISPDFALDSNKTGAILINEEENICIMINEEDHLRIQVLSAGLELENSLDLAIELDDVINKLVNYAFNDRFGFLTTCPTNVGTGLRASVMVHLPALTMSGNITKVLEVVNEFGMNIRGIYGEGSKSQGDIYQVSNKQSLGLSEKEIIKNIKTITEKITEQERFARKYLAKNSIDIEDRLYRAYGIIANCRKISSEEAKKLISEVKLGVDLGIIRELNDLQVNKLSLFTKPANMQIYLGKTLDAYERDVKRAEVIKNIINER